MGVRYAALNMNTATETTPVEEQQTRAGAMCTCSGSPLSSSWYYFWFIDPPAVLAGRSGLTSRET